MNKQSTSFDLMSHRQLQGVSLEKRAKNLAKKSMAAFPFGHRYEIPAFDNVNGGFHASNHQYHYITILTASLGTNEITKLDIPIRLQTGFHRLPKGEFQPWVRLESLHQRIQAYVDKDVVNSEVLTCAWARFFEKVTDEIVRIVETVRLTEEEESEEEEEEKEE